MTSYSVTEAKDNLSHLIDLALRGEDVVITRDGGTAVALRAVRHAPERPSPQAAHQWLRLRRAQRRSVAVTSVELLSEMYDADES